MGGWGGCGVCVDILHGLEEDSPAGGEEEEDEEMVDNNWGGNWGQLCRHPGCDEEKYGTEMGKFSYLHSIQNRKVFVGEKNILIPPPFPRLGATPPPPSAPCPPKYYQAY